MKEQQLTNHWFGVYITNSALLLLISCFFFFSLWHLNEARCKATQTGNESYLQHFVGPGLKLFCGQTGPWCTFVPCTLFDVHVLGSISGSLQLYFCFVIFLSPKQWTEHWFSSVHGCLLWFHRRGKHYSWMVDMQISPMFCCSGMQTSPTAHPSEKSYFRQEAPLPTSLLIRFCVCRSLMFVF